VLKYSLKLIYYDLVILFLNSTLKNKIKPRLTVIYTYGLIIGIIIWVPVIIPKDEYSYNNMCILILITIVMINWLNT